MHGARACRHAFERGQRQRAVARALAVEGVVGDAAGIQPARFFLTKGANVSTGRGTDRVLRLSIRSNRGHTFAFLLFTFYLQIPFSLQSTSYMISHYH